MSKKKRKKNFLVVQQGGSSTEWYPNWYYTRKDAQNFIDDAANNTYSCLGPFEIELDGKEVLFSFLLTQQNRIKREELRMLLRTKEAELSAAGGRGVDLADEIDTIRRELERLEVKASEWRWVSLDVLEDLLYRENSCIAEKDVTLLMKIIRAEFRQMIFDVRYDPTKSEPNGYYVAMSERQAKNIRDEFALLHKRGMVREFEVDAIEGDRLVSPRQFREEVFRELSS